MFYTADVPLVSRISSSQYLLLTAKPQIDLYLQFWGIRWRTVEFALIMAHGLSPSGHRLYRQICAQHGRTLFNDVIVMVMIGWMVTTVNWKFFRFIFRYTFSLIQMLWFLRHYITLSNLFYFFYTPNWGENVRLLKSLIW